MDLQIVDVDPGDLGMLRAFWEVEQSAQRASRIQPSLREYERLLAQLASPNPYYRQLPVAALRRGELVGTLWLQWGLRDNPHLAEAEINVRPDHWGRGTGRALHAEAVRRVRAQGRTTLIGEANAPVEGGGPALGFAAAMGAEPVHVEKHLVLDLPVDPGEVLRLKDRAHAPGHDILTWRDHCPDEHAEAFCRLQAQMARNVPMGALAYEQPSPDLERLRVGEERRARSFESIVAVARRTDDGVFAGYSLLLVPHHGTDLIQDDTLVMPEYRGRRLGTLLKLATLDIVQREHPARSVLHTWTAVDNHAMQRTNADFGFRTVELLHEVQQHLSD